jgi:hypothetical protein
MPMLTISWERGSRSPRWALGATSCTPPAPGLPIQCVRGLPVVAAAANNRRGGGRWAAAAGLAGPDADNWTPTFPPPGRRVGCSAWRTTTLRISRQRVLVAGSTSPAYNSRIEPPRPCARRGQARSTGPSTTTHERAGEQTGHFAMVPGAPPLSSANLLGGGGRSRRAQERKGRSNWIEKITRN